MTDDIAIHVKHIKLKKIRILMYLALVEQIQDKIRWENIESQMFKDIYKHKILRRPSLS